jgi:hypothetical protein
VEPLEARTVLAVVVPAGVSLTEGQTRQVFFKLSKAPTADVTFTIQSSNPSEATINTESLTFTPANWRTRQGVTISAVEDFAKDGNKKVKLVTSVISSTDSKYANKNVADVSVTVRDSKRVPPLDPSLYQGEYSGSFTGKRASGPIEATIDGRTISVEILVNAPAFGLRNEPAFGTGTIADDGSFSFTAQGSIFGAVYKGKILVGQNGEVSATGTWKYRTVANGTWKVDRISAVTPPGPEA